MTDSADRRTEGSIIVVADDVKSWGEQQKHDVKTWLTGLGIDPYRCCEIHRVGNEVRFRLVSMSYEDDGEHEYRGWVYAWTDWQKIELTPLLPDVIRADRS